MTSNPRSLVQLVPELPPEIGGIGDYTLALAQTLRSCHGVESVFVVLGNGSRSDGELEGFRVVGLQQQASADLTDVLVELAGARSAVLIQYVGYGFDRNGIPTWLIDGLDRWRRSAAGRPLMTIFHELYAKSWPWRRAFWFSRQQRNLAAQLARMSDACATPMQRAAEEVRRWRRGQEEEQTVYVTANPSLVGEPAIVPALAEREPRMVVFGTRATRERAYRSVTRELGRSCKLLGIQEVIDIGPGEIDRVTLPASVEFRRLGTLDREEVSALLLRCRTGFLDYPPQYLAKSTVFAAYCAHGILPVLGRRGPLGLDGIMAARHYWHCGLKTRASTGVQAIATEAHTWYSSHGLVRHALALAQGLDRLLP